MVKIINHRLVGGHLFHYAHFMCDLVFPEIINKVYNYNHVYRMKTISQTVGNFKKIWEQIFGIPMYEIDPTEFKLRQEITLTLGRATQYPSKANFLTVQDYIFNRFHLDQAAPVDHRRYPKILLIEREDRVTLIDDPDLKEICERTVNGVSTGKERRDIHGMEALKDALHATYNGGGGGGGGSDNAPFQCVTLAKMDFAEQIRYFNSAAVIILAHGAAQANTLFCRPGTVVVEVTCGCGWEFFDTISSALELNHVKCEENTPEAILELLGNTLERKEHPKTFYVCSYGGCGSTLLSNALKKYGKVGHIHSRKPPPERLTYRGREKGGNQYGEWFNHIKIPDDQLENYYVIYLYRNPVDAILSRFKNPDHLKHIQTNPMNTIQDVVDQETDLFGIHEFYQNYATENGNKNRNYNIYCVKYEELFDKQDELSDLLRLGGPLNLVKKETTKEVDELQMNKLNAVYKELIDTMANNPFIFVH